jgi:serine/threonine protein phosphatase PrpC
MDICIRGGDRVLLLSDGVFNTLSEEEIASAMLTEVHKSAALLQAAVLAKEKPDQDNFTAVIIELT